MKDLHPVFRRARKSLLLLAASLVLGLTLFLGSSHIREHLSRELAQIQAQQGSDSETLTQKREELKNIETSIEKFRQLRQKGLIGQARREEWIEQLIASRKQLGLPETLAYTLKQPAPLRASSAAEGASAEGSPTGDGNSGAPLAHNLEFELRDIHEGELLALLKTYQDKVPGRFRIDACRLGDPSETGLMAQCTLRFFTLPEKSTKPPS